MDQFEVIAGTYEEFLLGYKFILSNPTLSQSFASHDHSSSIRTLSTSNHYLASGATDDRIIIYDLKTRKEHCVLTHHTATVNCLQFTNNHSHIISGSADGVLAVVRVGNWQLEKIWDKAHNGKSILDIAIHSSGKLALTLGADASLRTWNLIKGRPAYVINLNSKSKDPRSLEKIIWAEDGVRFILYGGRYTEIWSIEIGGTLKIIEHPSKVCSCLWYTDKDIIVGYESGQLSRIKIETDSKSDCEAHKARIKALAKHKKWIISASSSGEIKVWNKHFEEQASTNSDCRITCMIISKIFSTKKETQNDLVEIKDEPLVMPAHQKSVVVVEIEEDSENDSVKNINNKKNKTGKTKQRSIEPQSVVVSKKHMNKSENVSKNNGNKKKKHNTELKIQESTNTETEQYFEKTTHTKAINKKRKKEINDLDENCINVESRIKKIKKNKKNGIHDTQNKYESKILTKKVKNKKLKI